MIKETYLSNVKRVMDEYPEAVFVYVNRGTLRPNSKLLKDFLYWKERFEKSDEKVKAREKAMLTSHYEYRYRKQIMNSQEALEKLRKINDLGREKDVYLVCYEKDPPCHRFLLIEMIKKLSVSWK